MSGYGQSLPPEARSQMSSLCDSCHDFPSAFYPQGAHAGRGSALALAGSYRQAPHHCPRRVCPIDSANFGLQTIDCKAWQVSAIKSWFKSTSVVQRSLRFTSSTGRAQKRMSCIGLGTSGKDMPPASHKDSDVSGHDELLRDVLSEVGYSNFYERYKTRPAMGSKVWTSSSKHSQNGEKFSSSRLTTLSEMHTASDDINL